MKIRRNFLKRSKSELDSLEISSDEISKNLGELMGNHRGNERLNKK